MAFFDQRGDSSNFMISWTPEPKADFGIFSKAYRQAAEHLAAFLLNQRRFPDYQAYPVFYCFRHALELILKHVIYKSAELALYSYINDIDGTLQNNHDLRKLARTASALLVRLFPNAEALHNMTSLVETTCAELSELDPGSYSYRYPIDTTGGPSTKKDQVVNLVAFANHMSSVLEELDTIDFVLEGEIDIAQDALYEEIQRNLY